MTKSRELAVYTLFACCFAYSIHLIFLTQNSIGFWLQADNAWAPHFVHDLVIQGHQPLHWALARVTIHLLDTVPFFIFSFFSQNILQWIYWNALFNLILFGGLFLILSRIIYENLASQTLLLLSALIVLLLIAGKQFPPFTMELLLISGQHMTQMLVAVFSLICVLFKLKHQENRWITPVLCFFLAVGTFSDLILVASFILPMTVCLSLYYLKEKQTIALQLIAYIWLSLTIGKLLWALSPFEYSRATFNPDVDWQVTVWGVLQYWKNLTQIYPAFVVLNACFLAAAVYTYTRIEKITIESLALLFCIASCLSGFSRMFLNYHAAKLAYATEYLNPTIYKFHFDAMTRDSIDLFFFPIFLGIPVLLAHWFKGRIWWLNALVFASTIFYMSYIALHYIPADSLQQKLKQHHALMACVQDKLRQHKLHAGVANFWIYRPVKILSAWSIEIGSMHSGITPAYEHYLSTWQEIHNKNFDFWIAEYDSFFNDPIYSSYYNTASDLRHKSERFGKPAGSFSCSEGKDAKVTVYYYRNNEIMRALAPSVSRYLSYSAQLEDNKMTILYNNSKI